jgi:hypothetical protein
MLLSYLGFQQKTYHPSLPVCPQFHLDYQLDHFTIFTFHCLILVEACAPETTWLKTLIPTSVSH